MKIKFKYVIVILVIPVIIWFIWTRSERPDLYEIEEQTKYWYDSSQTSYRHNYAELVQKEKVKNITFLMNEAVYAKIYDNHFPFTTEKIDFEKTRLILEILNDTSSYRWGEYGTPEYDKTLIYYGKTTDPIGYTLIDQMGEVENYPYRSIMKWGALSDKGYKRLLNEL